jgi:hypothetical protein
MLGVMDAPADGSYLSGNQVIGQKLGFRRKHYMLEERRKKKEMFFKE